MTSVMTTRDDSLASWTSDSKCCYNGDSLSFHLGLTHELLVLFEPCDFYLKRGFVTGLVGTNGAGKSSLARVILSQRLPGFPETDFTMEYLASEEDNDSDDGMAEQTPEEFLQSRIDQQVLKWRTEIDRLEAQLDDNSDERTTQATTEEVVNRLSELYEQVDDHLESVGVEMEEAFSQLSFSPYLRQKKIGQLSSGWRYKCRLIAALLTNPDLLIIDEPSFLDKSSTDWMIHRLRYTAIEKNSMVMIISHKETLLENLCDNHILYINAGNQTLTQYHCTYNLFRETHAANVAASRKVLANASEKVSDADQSLQYIQSQLRKREGTMKQKTEKDADKRWIKGKNKEAKQRADRAAASKVKQLQKQQASLQEELLQQTRTENVKPLRFPGFEAAENLAVLQDVAISYDGDQQFVFQNVEAILEPKDRVLLIGPNGCGKSTLVKILLGDLQPNEGLCRLAGTKDRCLYFPQTALSDLLLEHGRESALALLLKVDSNLTETTARQHLGNFGLRGNTALRPLTTLSAGQHVRLWLAKQQLLQSKPCLLILDEISENIDVETRKSLIDLLNHFVGAVVAISHDPDFCNQFQPTKIWELFPYGMRVQYPTY